MRRIVELSGKGEPSARLLQRRIIAFHRYGHEFHGAARKTGSPLVRFYLTGHAFELFLKAWLLSCGMTTATLKSRKFGHNISGLLDECIRRDFTGHFRVSPQLESDTAEFTAIYAAKSLEYFLLADVLGPPKLPDMSRIFRFVALLDRELTGVIVPET